MPLYEYQCDACGNRFERIQKFSDPPADKCPKCGGVVRKLISSPAIQFKGSGWYVTDYAKKPESAGKPGSDSGSETGSGTAESGSAKSSPTESTAKDAPKDTPKPAADKATPGSKT
jgi:putative FmdB family regulatory protein